jgi:protein gp37
MIFPFSMTDLFLDFYDDHTVARGIAMMVAARRHFFQPLTKRSPRMMALLNDDAFWEVVHAEALKLMADVFGRGYVATNQHITGVDATRRISSRNPPPNIMWGVSVGLCDVLDRVLDLIATPAALRNVSYEPALEAVDFSWAVTRNRLDIGAAFLTRARFAPGLETIRPLDQLIFGGGGRGRQHCDVDWGRSALAACRVGGAGTSFFMKQTGSNAVDRGARIVLTGKDAKGAKEHNIPADLRVREIPAAITAWLTRSLEVRAA